MLIDVQGDQADETFETRLPVDLIDAVSAFVSPHKVIQLKNSDWEHLLTVRHTGSVVGAALVAITQETFGGNIPGPKIHIKDVFVSTPATQPIIVRTIVAYVKEMAAMMDAQIICAEDLMHRMFTDVTNASRLCVTLRTIEFV
eukprot:Protomagalhaensia_sp_Gyna_25__3858@NODE_3467_length_567_cov_64_560606_g2920_i0_p1_GENE_NODE_3467_length_567_cov_64_560606_g2920_i0NODE_3467_length_567_cov_64_560606_g2920_i0_p1_ORF_typecomplete_len143_score18_56_NODE_3467_length_567_cov_64_560606_g2920_i082510